MKNDKDGPATLRHVYVLLVGLGLVESSGAYCTGRQQSAPFDQADNAEAGLFQASWGAHKRSPKILSDLFESYRPTSAGAVPDPAKCMLEVFKPGANCTSLDAVNYGDPQSDGYKWQAVTKACPAFAAEYAAVLLRVLGGLPPKKGEWGPIGCHIRNATCRKANLYPKCDAMFIKVQKYLSDNPSACAAIR